MIVEVEDFNNYATALQEVVKFEEDMRISRGYKFDDEEVVFFGYAKNKIHLVFLSNKKVYYSSMPMKEFNVLYNHIGMFRTGLAKAGINGEI